MQNNEKSTSKSFQNKSMKVATHKFYQAIYLNRGDYRDWLNCLQTDSRERERNTYSIYAYVCAKVEL